MEGASYGVGIELDNGRKLSLCTTTLSDRCNLSSFSSQSLALSLSRSFFPHFSLTLSLSVSLSLSLSSVCMCVNISAFGSCSSVERVRVNRRRKSRSGVESSIYEHRLIPREFYPAGSRWLCRLRWKAIGRR